MLKRQSHGWLSRSNARHGGAPGIMVVSSCSRISSSYALGNCRREGDLRLMICGGRNGSEGRRRISDLSRHVGGNIRGAYTAGVFDFLIQALDEWENAKTGRYLEKGDDPGAFPNHLVGIKAMFGA
jgi:hypothetical protein